MNYTEQGTIAVGAPGSAMRRITSSPEPKYPCTVGAENWPPVNYNVRTRTPWGTAQTAYYFAPGLISYSTAGHGGFHVSNGLLKRIPDYMQIAANYTDGRTGWYEEDCEWAIVCVCLPEFFPMKWRYDAVDIMRRYYPDAWQRFSEVQS